MTLPILLNSVNSTGTIHSLLITLQLVLVFLMNRELEIMQQKLKEAERSALRLSSLRKYKLFDRFNFILHLNIVL